MTIHVISRREVGGMLLSAGIACSLPETSGLVSDPPAEQTRFAHPGMLQSRCDLIRMRDGVLHEEQPLYSGFEVMRDHPQSQKSYVSSGAFVEIGRNPNLHFGEFDRDSNAAYQCAIMSFITGDLAYAEVSIGILNAWSDTLTKISGADAVLCASLGGFKMANAAELIRHGNVGWAAESADKFGQMLRAVFLPVIENFAPFANGNWDTAAIKLMLAIAIYTDDRALFDRAVEYHRFGCGDGRLAHYIYSNGQCQESGRDQQHTQLGIAHQGDCCEIAWHQGLDLYGYLDNRLLLGFEYTAKYCLGEDVPFEADVDQTGKYRHSVISVRGALRSVYEQIYNHYVKRKGLVAPWTQKAAEKLRPEGAPFQADATGYGTLLYTRHAGPDVSEAASVGVPAGLHAQWTGQDIDLDFVPLAAAARYVVTRSEGPRGQLVAIRSDIDGGSLKDRPRKASTTYTYHVRAVGSRHSSAGVAQMTGLPQGWLTTLPGEYRDGNEASFDGKRFRLSAAGDPNPSRLGQFFVTHRAMKAEGEFVARMLPLFGSQFLTAGIYAGSELEQVLLTISPRGGAAEHPIWSLSLLHSPGPAEKLETLSRQPLASPVIEHGRIMRPVWLSLKGSKKELIASSSLDAVHWSELGSVARPTGTLRAGLALNSGLGAPTTEVCFDEIAI